jgi:hypothetical protein
MNIWAWIHNLAQAARSRGDKPRMTMVASFYEAMDVADENPDVALSLLDQSRTIAQQHQELWWIQLVNHWELQYRLYNKRDLTNTLELAVQSTVETRKPHFAEFPQRICLHEDLIRVYMQQDPLGHLDMIENALDYMESQLNPRVECFLCFQQLKTLHKIVTNDFDGANANAHAFLSYANHDAFHLCHAYQDLCEIAFHQKDWQAIGRWAYLGESVAKTQHNNTDQLIEFGMWQAVFERFQGYEKEAQQRYRSAAKRATQYQGGLDRAYFDALCAYHELGGELEKALLSREAWLDSLTNTAHYYDECNCLIDIIRLQTALQMSISDMMTRFETCVRNLQRPASVREKLTQILNNGTKYDD